MESAKTHCFFRCIVLAEDRTTENSAGMSGQNTAAAHLAAVKICMIVPSRSSCIKLYQTLRQMVNLFRFILFPEDALREFA